MEIAPPQKEVLYNLRISLNPSTTLAQTQEIIEIVGAHKMVRDVKFVMEEKK